MRYEHEHPAALVRSDTRKLGRMRYRITADRRDSVHGASWEFRFVAIDDRAHRLH